MRRLAATVAVLLVLLGALLAGRARPSGPDLATFREDRQELRRQANAARDRRCRPNVHPFVVQAAEIRHRLKNLRTWTRRRDRARAQSSRCVPEWPWGKLAACESGRRWHLNVGTFDGGLQFHPDTWTRATSLARRGRKYDYAWQAPAYVQVAVARDWKRRTSWEQWPTCARKLGLI